VRKKRPENWQQFDLILGVLLNMELVEDLISQLKNNNYRLVDVLTNAKVLAHRLKEPIFKEWLNNEIEGYKTDSLPNYRIFPCEVICTMNNGYHEKKNEIYPKSAVPQEVWPYLFEIKLNDGINEVELLSDKDKIVFQNISPEICSLLSQNINFQVTYAQKRISNIRLSNIISTVKNRLLDFLLEIEDKFDESANFNQQEIHKIMEKTIFGGTTTIGDNATIIIGDRNYAQVSNQQNLAGNLQELQNELRKHQVPEEDIMELVEIIPNESPDIEKKEFGPKVKSWLKKMTSKAIDGVWNVGIGTAGGILATTLSKYYGWM
jgi:hypothetical protein